MTTHADVNTLWLRRPLGAGMAAAAMMLAGVPASLGAPAPAASTPIVTPGNPAAAPAPIVTPGATAQPAVPVQPGTGGVGTPAARTPGAADFLPFVILAALLVFMITASVVGGRRERKRREAMLASLGKQDRVQTVGGIIGTIVELKDDEVVLKVDENSNTRIRFTRGSVQQVLREGGQGGAKPEPAEAASKPGGR